MSHRSAPPLPVSTPTWVTPSRIALTVITLAAASAALPAVWWIPPARSDIGDDPNAARAVAAITALLSLLLARRALRTESVTKAVLWSIAGGVLAGVVNTGVACGAVQVIQHGDLAAAVISLLAGLFFGGFVGGPLGLAFGLAYAFVLASASRAELDPSHDGPDRVLLTAGIWLTLAGVGLSAIADDSPAPVPPMALVALGAPAAAVAIVRLQARRRWLAKVTRGLLPAYRVEEPADDGEIPRHLLPVVRLVPSKRQGILLYSFRDGASPYRDPASSVPVAIAEAPPRPADPASPDGSDKEKYKHTKSGRRLPQIKLPEVGPDLRNLALDLFIVLTKTIGISLLLLVFATALAIPFVSCASALSLDSYDLR